MEFNEKLQELRRQKGLTQEELGKRLGVTNKAVSKWEVGETTPDITVLEPLAKIFQVTVDELLLGKEHVVENKKNIKINKILLIFVIVLGALELLTLCSLVVGIVSVNLYYRNEINELLNKEERVSITNENSNDYIEVLPMSSFTNDGQTIVVNSLVKTSKNYDIVSPIVFDITYRISYFYYDNQNKVGVVTYSRNFTGQLENGENSYDILIELSPKTQITDYAFLKNVVVEYEINQVSGEVILK